jgi:hypothetical protein
VAELSDDLNQSLAVLDASVFMRRTKGAPRRNIRCELPCPGFPLPGKLAGKEMDLVTGCRAHGFGIWPTLSEPIQVRIGILNQLTPEAIAEIVSRFADAMLDMGAESTSSR